MSRERCSGNPPSFRWGSSQWWEWKCRGKVYFDLEDLANALIRRRGTAFRPERHRTMHALDKRPDTYTEGPT